MAEIISKAAGPKWAPQIIVLLDDEARVLSANKALAGTSFDLISESAQEQLHSQLHPGCDGKCRFNKMWKKAWASLTTRDSVEWELDDPKLSRMFRLNLAKTPAPRNIKHERRQRHKLLTITDITKYRRDYESLIEQQQALIRLLMSQGLEIADVDEDPFDEEGDTGNRLMAGYLKTERSLNRQLVIAQERERKRVAADLHDGLAQMIGAIKYRIENNVARLVQQNPAINLSDLEDTVEDVKALVEEVRRISSHLSPSMLEDFGVQVALEWLCKEFKAQNRDVTVNCKLHIDEGNVPELVKVAIYRVVQEAFNNITKHAAATSVDATLIREDDAIELLIADNGTGIESSDAQRGYDGKGGLGLTSMRERVEATGGQFSLDSAPGKGVKVRATWVEEASDINPSGSHSE